MSPKDREGIAGGLLGALAYSYLQLSTAGIGLGAGYYGQLARIILSVASCLWVTWLRFGWAPSLVAAVGAIICATLLPGQLSQGAYSAAAMNLLILVTLMAAATTLTRKRLAEWP